MSIWLFVPIVFCEALGSYGIGAYGRFHDWWWAAVTFVSFGLTGVALAHLAGQGGQLSWLSLLVFGCITPIAGYVVGLLAFGEKFHIINLVALTFVGVAIVLLSIQKS